MAEQPNQSLRERKKQAVRKRILRSAERLIRQRGYAATRMRDIAQAAEISYQTLYNYFPTKGLILRSLLTDSIRNIAQPATDLLAGGETLLEALDALNALFSGVVTASERALWRTATAELLAQDAEATGLYRLIDSMTGDPLRHLLRRARNTGEISTDVSLAHLADVLFDLADYRLLRLVLDPDEQPAAALNLLGTRMRLVLAPYLNIPAGEG